MQILAECLQCYCGEIRQMLMFIINLIAQKPSIGLIIWYVSDKKAIILKPNIFTGTQTQDSFWVCDLCSSNLLAKQTNLVLEPFFYRA
jgi:hypothetical protein